MSSHWHDRILAARQSRPVGKADTGLRSEATARQVSALEREIDEWVFNPGRGLGWVRAVSALQIGCLARCDCLRSVLK